MDQPADVRRFLSATARAAGVPEGVDRMVAAPEARLS